MVFDIFTLVEAVWLILPAYAANGLVPLIAKARENHPIDGGQKLLGRPLLGSGKTWEGLILGSLIGGLIGFVEWYFYPFLPWHISQIPLYIAPMSAYLGFFLGFGAMVGDMAGSFLKRRFKMIRGEPAPLLDQEDFVLGALFFGALVTPVLQNWVILLIVITPLFHWTANLIGYLLKVKEEPW